MAEPPIPKHLKRDAEGAFLNSDPDIPAAQREQPVADARWKGGGGLPGWQRIGQGWRRFLADQVSPVRLASHVTLLLITGLVVVLSRWNPPKLDQVLSLPATEQIASAETGQQPSLPFERSAMGGSLLQGTGVLLPAPVPFTEIPERPRLEIITYTVQVNDTVQGIAERFGLHPNTVVWANQELEENPFLLEVGQKLLILPVDGVLHKVRPGDTIKSIAQRYRVAPEKIVAYELNGLDSVDATLTPGQQIIVPGGDKSPPGSSGKEPIPPWRAREMVWPTFGRLTQGYWRPGHPAIDIGAWTGTVVRAADEGTVIAAGWSTVGYGNYVIIRHIDGFQTLYAHLSRIDVKAGQKVARGQQIGLVGSTGHSTGPHLHFEVRFNHRAYNPLAYLP